MRVEFDKEEAEGREAFENAKGFYSNPYQLGTDRYGAWSDGYSMAEDEVGEP